VYPSTGVNVGSGINLTCTLNYNAPSRDVNSAFPLSDNQDPRLQLYIGQNEIMSALGNLVIGTDTLPDLKSLVSNDLPGGELYQYLFTGCFRRSVCTWHARTQPGEGWISTGVFIDFRLMFAHF